MSEGHSSQPRGSHWPNLSIKRKITILFNNSTMCREKGLVNLMFEETLWVTVFLI